MRLPRSSPSGGRSRPRAGRQSRQQGQDRVDLLAEPLAGGVGGQTLLLAVTGLPLGVELGVHIVGADEQRHNIGVLRDDLVEPLRDVVRELPIDAGVDELQFRPTALQSRHVVGTELPLGIAVPKAYDQSFGRHGGQRSQGNR